MPYMRRSFVRSHMGLGELQPVEDLVGPEAFKPMQ